MAEMDPNCGYEYDLCMVLPTKADSGTPEPSNKSDEIMKSMKAAGLVLKCYFSVQQDEIIVKIHAPLDLLQRFADKIDFKMLLDKEKLQAACERGDPENGINPINIQHDPTITEREPYESIYAKYDMEPSLQEIYAVPSASLGFSVNHMFRESVRIKLITMLLEAPRHEGGCGIALRKLLHRKRRKILAYFPFHHAERTEHLVNTWLDWKIEPWNQPLWDVKEYFGEKIGLYFAFLGHYTTWCIVPAVLGFFAFIHILVVGVEDAGKVETLPVFAIIVSFWAIFMLEFWKRKQATLAMEWGMTGFEEEEQDRPEFTGERIRSFIDGKEILYYPPGERSKMVCKSVSIILTLVLLVLSLVGGIFALRIYLVSGDAGSWGKSVGPILASVLNAFQIQIMNLIYGEIAVGLTNAENHRTDTQYEDSLIAKLFMFQFVNSYASFYYIAFIHEGILGEECDSGSCMGSLFFNLLIIFGSRLVTGNIIEVLIPYVKAAQRAKAEGITDDNTDVTESEKQYILEQYDVMMGTLGDYAEIAIQFGYVTLFVTAFPLAPLMALISNYVEIRSDGFKLIKHFRRPVLTGAEDIGTWQDIFTVLAVITVVTNAGITTFTMTLFNQYPVATRLWLFILFMFVVFGIQFMVQAIVDDVPEDVGIQIERQDFIVSKIIDKIADEADDELLGPVDTSNIKLTIDETEGETSPLVK